MKKEQKLQLRKRRDVRTDKLPNIVRKIIGHRGSVASGSYSVL
jgi:hypothetical protein